jgi:electron transfer flavoprotein beta subunit
VSQELGGGTVAEEEVQLPAVLGLQTARQAPRYVSISRYREIQQAGGIEEVEIQSSADEPDTYRLRRLFPPDTAGHAEMLTGTPAEVAERIAELIRSKGLVKS